MSNFLGSINPYLATFLASLIPVLENQAAVPLGLLQYHLSPWAIIGISTLAGMAIPAATLPILDWVIQTAKRLHPNIRNWVDGVLESRLRRHAQSFDRYGSIALALFIAIPGPFTGAWSATLLAYIFGIRYPLAIASIGLGSGLASLVLLGLVLGGRELFGQL